MAPTTIWAVLVDPGAARRCALDTHVRDLIISWARCRGEHAADDYRPIARSPYRPAGRVQQVPEPSSLEQKVAAQATTRVFIPGFDGEPPTIDEQRRRELRSPPQLARSRIGHCPPRLRGARHTRRTRRSLLLRRSQP